MKKRLFFIVWCTCAFIALSCKRSTVDKHWIGGFIERPGTYQLAETSCVVKVWRDSENLIKHSISHPGFTPFVSKERASAFSSWIMYVDTNGWVWFESGDIGTSVTKKNANSYEEVPLVEQGDLIAQMPKVFYEKLPSSAKAKWDRYRSDLDSNKK